MIIIMKNGKGDVDFNRGWDDYKNGFGSLSGDFWLGLEDVHRLTKLNEYQLRVDIQYYNETWKQANYDNFKIANQTEKYRLTLGSYSQSSTIEDGLAYHDEQYFSTPDSDNDNYYDNCAEFFQTGWWFNRCYNSKLTGKVYPKETESIQGIIWNIKSGYKTVKAVLMRLIKL